MKIELIREAIKKEIRKILNEIPMGLDKYNDEDKGMMGFSKYKDDYKSPKKSQVNSSWSEIKSELKKMSKDEFKKFVTKEYNKDVKKSSKKISFDKYYLDFSKSIGRKD
jgi:flagellin-like hook-associated protein FlgL